MTLDQQLTILVALAVYGEHCKEGMRLFAGEDMKAYYKKELGRVREARITVEAMETDHNIEPEGGKADGPGSGEQEGAHNGPASPGAAGPNAGVLREPQEPRGL